MTEKNSWELILSWKDIAQYFYKYELLEISTTCRLIRQKHKPIIFNDLDFTWFPPYFESSNDTHDNSNSMSDEDQLAEQMLPMSHFLKTLSLGTGFNFRYLISLLPLIHRLEYLQLFDTILQFKSITQVLTGLSQLKCLKLNRCKIAFFSSDSTADLSILIPITLNSLYIEKCYTIKSTSECDPLQLSYKFNGSNSTRHNFGLKTRNFPQLKHLAYNCKVSDGREILENFLQINTQLNTIQTYLININQSILNLLSKFKQLKSLTLSCCLPPNYNINITNIPNIIYIIELKLLDLNPISMQMAHILCLSCPNISQLSLHYHSQLEPQYNQLLSQLPILKKLSLIGYKGHMSLMRTTINFDRVKLLYLTRFYIDQVDLTKFESFELIESIIIKYSYIEDELEELIECHYNQFTNWNCKFTRDYIKCSLIDK